jgi:hypothetical protein
VAAAGSAAGSALAAGPGLSACLLITIALCVFLRPGMTGSPRSGSVRRAGRADLARLRARGTCSARPVPSAA